MIERLEESHLLLTWGVTVALAWILTPVMGAMGFIASEVMYMWTVLMIPPLGMTGVLKYRGDSNRLFDIWAVLVAALMVQNFLAPATIALYSYYHLWIIAGAAAFYYTSKRIPPPSEKTYRYAAYASIAVMPLVIYRPLLSPEVVFAVQGGPMLYDWYAVHK